MSKQDKAESENRRAGEPVKEGESVFSSAALVVKAPSPAPRLSGSPVQIVLGLDPGLATTGWGIISKAPRSLSLIQFGAFLTPAGDALPDRLCSIRSQLSRVIQEYRPTVMAIEQLFFAKFAVSIASTAQARGVILQTAAEHGLAIVEYNPRAVKIALTGFGSASKIQMQLMLQQFFKLKELPRPDDAADAVAMALCHVQTRTDLKASSEMAPGLARAIEAAKGNA